MKNIVIVGGGISGLAAAYALQEQIRTEKAPLACTLIEEQKRLGGKILTEHLDHFIVEAGPDSFITQKPWAIQLCHKLGLSDRLVKTNQFQKNIYIYSRGRLHLLPEGLVLMVPTRLMPFLRTSLISPWGKLRMAMDLLIPPRKGTGDESLASFARRRLGQEALDKIVEPLMAGIYAGRAEDLGLESTFPQLRALEQQYGSLTRGLLAKRREAVDRQKVSGSDAWTLFMTLKGGMGELVETLVSRLDGVRLMTERRVRSICPAGQGRAVYHIELADGNTLMADGVILATPAYVTAELIKRFDPALAQSLCQIPYVGSATVSLAYKRDDCRHPLDGFGFVVSRTEGRRLLACTWTSTKFPHRAPQDHVLIRCFVGGSGQESLLELDDHDMTRMAREELKITMGIDAAPVMTRIYRWEKANPLYTVGHQDRLARIEELLKPHPGLVLTGSAYYGVGIPDCIHSGTRAAQKALEFLSHSGSLTPARD